MKYEIIKLANLSGARASIYSVVLEGDGGQTLYEKFIVENRAEYFSEVQEISYRLRLIGSRFGAREDWFKLKEGKGGDLVCALYDMPEKHLRLYCIRFGTDLIVLGGGGPKPEGMKALQESPKLTAENAIMRLISDKIYELRMEGDLSFSVDGMDLIGQLTFNDEEEE